MSRLSFRSNWVVHTEGGDYVVRDRDRRMVARTRHQEVADAIRILPGLLFQCSAAESVEALEALQRLLASPEWRAVEPRPEPCSSGDLDGPLIKLFRDD